MSQTNNTELFVSGQVLGHIVSYLGSDSDSISKLLVALYKYVHLIAPNVVQLDVTSPNRSCHLLASNFLQQFINLQKVSMSFTLNTVHNVVPLPLSVKSISYRSRDSTTLVHLLGRASRPNLTSLYVCSTGGDDSNFLCNNTHEFVYPNLTSLKLQHLDITSPKLLPYSQLHRMMTNINSKSPNLERLFLSFRTSYCVDLGSNTTIDISFFAQLRKLKLDLKHWNHAWEANFVLPQQLKSLSAPCKIINNILYSVPLLQLVKIRLITNGQLILPIERLAPNLQTLTSKKKATLQAPFRNSLPSFTDSFTKLTSLHTIGGVLLSWNWHLWSAITQAIQNGMILDIEKVDDFVEIGRDHCEFVPPFNMIDVSEPALVQKMPIPTLCRVESLCLRSPLPEDWVFLSKLPLNVVELDMTGIDINQYFEKSKFLVNFCHLLSLKTLHIGVKPDCVGLETLAHIKQVAQNCLPPSLTKLHLWHQRADLLFQDLCQYGVDKVRSNGISLVTLLQKLPNLKWLYCEFPIIDIDEPEMCNTKLGRLTKLCVKTWRGGSASFDDTHLKNVMATFYKPNIIFSLSIYQPAWTSRWPDSNKTFTSIADIPQDLQRLSAITTDLIYSTKLVFVDDTLEHGDDQDVSSDNEEPKNQNQILYQRIIITND